MPKIRVRSNITKRPPADLPLPCLLAESRRRPCRAPQCKVRSAGMQPVISLHPTLDSRINFRVPRTLEPGSLITLQKEGLH
jgi:hypothetical protein